MAGIVNLDLPVGAPVCLVDAIDVTGRVIAVGVDPEFPDDGISYQVRWDQLSYDVEVPWSMVNVTWSPEHWLMPR